MRFLLILFVLSLNALEPSRAAMSCSELLSDSKSLLSPQELATLMSTFEAFDFERSPVTMGIEIEGYVRREVEHDDLLAFVDSAVREQNPFVFTEVIFETVEYEMDGFIYNFQVTEERLLGLDPAFVPVEIVSPIMRTASDFELFHSVIEGLGSEFEFTEFPFSGGVHVHFGFPDPRPQEIVLLSYIMSHIEDELYAHIGVSKNRLPMAPKLSLLKDYVRYAFEADSMQELQSRGLLDQFGLSFFALREHGTVEFRMFNSSTNRFKNELVLDFVRALVVGVRSKNPKLMAVILESSRRRELSLETLGDAIGVDIRAL